MARRSTFSGGIFPDLHHSAIHSPIGHMPAPRRLFLPAPEIAPLPEGTRVLRGQVIGTDGCGLPLHSSVSGTITGIDSISGHPHYVLENDGEYTLHPDCVPFTRPLAQTSSEEIAEIIGSAGINDAPENGPSLPERIASFREKGELLIINGCETQPYMTALSRLLLERPDHVINGTKILLKALGIRQAVIALGEENLDAANRIESLIAGSKLIRVRIMLTKYPQEEPHQLIYALTEKEPAADRPLEESGCMVVRADTCAAIFHTFATGIPHLERLITVSGSRIKTRRNLFVPIGTPAEDVLAYCDGLKGKADRLIAGGPLNGNLLEDPALPITRQTTALLAMAAKTPRYSACIRCGRCYEVCPMHLMPAYLAEAARKNQPERCLQYGIHSCVECGCCAYVCPGKVPLVQEIRAGKAALINETPATPDEPVEQEEVLPQDEPALPEATAQEEPAAEAAEAPPAEEEPAVPEEPPERKVLPENEEERLLAISQKIRELKQRSASPAEASSRNCPEEESEQDQ